MAVMTTRWGVLYCPKTGLSSKQKRWEKIDAVLKQRGICFDMVQSETADSVERLMTMLINNGYKTIIIVGGDSALNDAVNCLMKVEKSLARRDSPWRYSQWCDERLRPLLGF